jgi:hypothetical protein
MQGGLGGGYATMGDPRAFRAAQAQQLSASPAADEGALLGAALGHEEVVALQVRACGLRACVQAGMGRSAARTHLPCCYFVHLRCAEHALMPTGIWLCVHFNNG